MVKFELTAEKECIIGGIGLITAGETVQVTNEQMRAFANVHGYPLAESNFPPFVTLVAVTEDEGGE